MMKDRKLSSLGNLLGGALARYGISERVTAAQIVSSANKILDDLLTQDQRSDVRVVSFKQSELLLACKSATARYAVEGYAKQLGRRLEEIYPDQTFTKVTCVLRNAPASDDEWYNTEQV